MTRMVVIVAVVVVAGLAVITLGPSVYEHITGVGVMRTSRKSKTEKIVSERRPTARAYIIGSGVEGLQAEVPIYSVNDIYASVGVGPDDFSSWQSKYGFGTFGRTKEGVLFVPGYPVLSKVAWMGIDPVDLSSTETSMLIEECTWARSRAVSVAAGTEMEALITLARKAIAVGGAVRFSLP